MPLKPGKASIGANIKELKRPSKHAPSGRSPDQALAIALRIAGVPKRADGGHVGALRGDTEGRADDIQTSVPDGSYIIPADVVSALGDGNTEAGFAKLEKMFPNSVQRRASGGGVSMKGVSMPMPKIPHAPKMPAMSNGIPHMRMPKIPGVGKFADVGASKGVDVRLSDGEFGVSNEDVARIGDGDPERGTRALNHFVMQSRAENIAKLKKLPKPVGA